MSISASTLFGRSFRVTIADKEFGSVGVERPLTFSFSVQRDNTITPNNANILLYNLNEDTRAELEQLSGGFGQGTGKATATVNGHHPKVKTKHNNEHQSRAPKAKAVAFAPQDKGVTVLLEAGYGEHIGTLFFGVLRKVSSWRQGADWLTQISGGDAEHSIATAKISKTFVKGTQLTTVLRELVKALPVGQGGINNTLTALQAGGFLSGGDKLSRALTFHGDAATALEQFTRSIGFSWSIQDNNFYCGPAGTPTFPGEGPLLTPNTGLIDTPQIDREGKLVGKALLNPDLLPGRVFRVESSRVTGNFLCTKTQHKGDSTGAAWFCEFVGTPPAKGSKAAELAKQRGDTGWI